MFGLKIFVRVQTFRRAPPVPPHNFCHPALIYIYAINSTAGKDSRLFECAIYRKPARIERNYIASIDFESDIGPKHWVMFWNSCYVLFLAPNLL